MSKGSKRRPMQVSEAEFEANWRKAFGKKPVIRNGMVQLPGGQASREIAAELLQDAQSGRKIKPKDYVAEMLDISKPLTGNEPFG